MSIFISLSSLALRQVVDGACTALGVKESGDAVVGFLSERFTDHSQRLTKALQDANDNAWKALEIALAGDSLWERCKATVARAEDKAFAQQVRAFLDATPLPELAGKAAFRQKCLEELRAARKGQALAASTPDPRQLAQETADFARFSDPTRLLDAEWRMVVALASQIKEAGFPNLAWLLAQRPQEGTPLLVAGVRYFFRRAVEEDQKLFQGLSFARLEALGEAQEAGFGSLRSLLEQRSNHLEQLLVEITTTVVETHAGVQRIEAGQQRLVDLVVEMRRQQVELLARLGLRDREVRPTDTTAIRTDEERRLVRELLTRYRALPEDARQKNPDLLSGLAQLENASGDHEQAVMDFRQVAALVPQDRGRQGEAHFNAYRAVLEKAGQTRKAEDWQTAILELVKAANLDPKRYLPFDASEYGPVKILGAGAFGVTFLCKHKRLGGFRAIKTLLEDQLDRSMDKVFAEGQVLESLNHPNIVRIFDAKFADPKGQRRPYFVMEYVENTVTLQDQVEAQGRLPVEAVLGIARQIAEGLNAAHTKGILHRDIKPANVLIRREGAGWQVKIIDFGLALRRDLTQEAAGISTSQRQKSMLGSSVAGTLDYSAPEQMGKLPGVEIGPHSDIYAFGKTVYFTLFGTPTPDDDDKDSLPEGLKRLLSRCTAQTVGKRPQNFTEVVMQLAGIEESLAPSVEDAEPVEVLEVIEKKAKVRFVMESKERSGLGKWFGTTSKGYLFKVYADGKFRGEGHEIEEGIDVTFEVSLGRHNIEVAWWAEIVHGLQEMSRKRFTLDFPIPGEYVIRFSFVFTQHVLKNPTMEKSTLEILAEPE